MAHRLKLLTYQILIYKTLDFSCTKVFRVRFWIEDRILILEGELTKFHDALTWFHFPSLKCYNNAYSTVADT